MHLGTVLAFLVSPAIIVALGWEALFYISGAIGALWVCVWLWRTSDTPEECPRITRAELAAILEGRPQAPRVTLVPWNRIVREQAVWAIVLAHFCSNFGFNILLLWLPTYLDKTFGVPLSKVGWYSLVPWIATFVTSNAAGWTADRMRRGGLSTGATRKILQSVAFAGGALPLLMLPSVHTVQAAIALVTLSAASSGIGLAAFAVNHLDIGPRYAGVLMGISNTVATVPGIIGVAAAGFIWRATGSFAAVFYVIAVVYLIGLAGYDLWASGEQKL